MKIHFFLRDSDAAFGSKKSEALRPVWEHNSTGQSCGKAEHSAGRYHAR